MRLFTTFFQQATQLLIVGLFLIGPFIVRYDQLPWGYETPKGMFVFLMCAIIAVFGLVALLPQLKKSEINRRQVLSPLLVIIGWLIFITWQASDPQIALWGNQYRGQGLLFNLATIAVWALLPYILDKHSSDLILGVLIVIGVAQSVIALQQVVNLLLNYSFSELTAGFYINGTYGQSEFFSGKMLLTLGLILFAYVRFRSQKAQKWLQIILIIALIICLLALFFSFSLAAWGVAAIGLVMYVYPFAKEKWGRMSVKRVYTILVVIACGLFIAWLRYDYRGVIWNEAIKFITTHSPLWGIGLDNQQFAFAAIPNVIIDRGHNLLIDIIITTGWGGLSLVVIFLVERIQKLYGQIMTLMNVQQRIILITLVMLILRLVVHTTSAMNIVELILISAWWENSKLLGDEKSTKI